MTTINVQGTDYDLVDTGDAWVIHQTGDILDQVAATIVDTYRIQSEIAAEHGRTITVGLTQVTVDILSRHLPALAQEGGITVLTYDMLVAPHTGEWAGTKAADVVVEIERLLDGVRSWVVDALDRQQGRMALVADLLVRSRDGGVARAQLKQEAAAVVPGVYSESEFARRAGVDRMTVRNWLGKR